MIERVALFAFIVEQRESITTADPGGEVVCGAQGEMAEGRWHPSGNMGPCPPALLVWSPTERRLCAWAWNQSSYSLQKLLSFQKQWLGEPGRETDLSHPSVRLVLFDQLQL